jgi:hypothetical protein
MQPGKENRKGRKRESNIEVVVWIPSKVGSIVKKKEGLKDGALNLPASVIWKWSMYFTNLLSALFGGATAHGVRDLEFSERMARLFRINVDTAYQFLATQVGGFSILASQGGRQNPEWETRVPSNAELWNYIALMDVQREPVTTVSSFAAGVAKWQEDIIASELLTMGRETGQDAVAYSIGGRFVLTHLTHGKA